MQKVLDRTSSEKERADLEAHVNLCRDCAIEFKCLQLSIELQVSMPVPEPSPEFTSDTVKKAFKTKRKQRLRQKIASWCLSGLTGIVSVFFIAGWNIILQPAIRWILINMLSIFSEWRVISNALIKVLFSLVKVLRTLGDAGVKVVWEGCSPVFFGYMIALTIMVCFILVTGIRSSVFSSKGGNV